MRSLLFIPADSERKLAKGLGSGADCLLLDLEDSIAQENKAKAREAAAEFLRSSRNDARCLLYVRINPLDSGLAEDDLAAIMPAQPDGIMLPKANGMEQAWTVSRLLDLHESEYGIEKGNTDLLPLMAETAAGVLAAHSWNQPMARLAGLTWGAEDLSADLGIASSRDAEGRYIEVFRFARLVTTLAAATCSTAAIDTVYVDFRNEQGLREECAAAVRDGFTGKLAIHPGQVPVINEIFSVAESEIADARKVVDAFEQAGNPGVLSMDGKMYDRPHLSRAQRLLARAARQNHY